MPDIKQGIGSNISMLYKDMGDGTQAPVVYVGGGGSGGSGSTVLPAGTDRSGSIAAGGTAQQLAPANAARTMLIGQNISAGDLWVNETGGTAAVDTAGSFRISAGQAFAIGTNRVISIVGATTGQKFTATES